MAEAIVEAFLPVVGQKHPVETITLIPSSGGRFEITLDGELIYSKASTGLHTTNEATIELIRRRSSGGVN